MIRLINHNCRVERRLVIQRLPGEGINKAGNAVAMRINGIPRREGLENWSKKLRFMVRFRGLCLELWVFC